MKSENFVPKLVSCLQEIQAENTQLSKKFTELEKRPIAVEANEIGQIASENALPTGVVIASIRKCDTISGNWSDYEHGYGRIIVGAGQPTQKQYATSDYPYWHPNNLPKNTENRKALTNYEAETSGGQERVALLDEELPSHAHGIYFSLGEGPGASLRWFNESGVSNTVASQSKGPESGGHHPIVGENAAHDNMPPFIALYYCTKK